MLAQMARAKWAGTGIRTEMVRQAVAVAARAVRARIIPISIQLRAERGSHRPSAAPRLPTRWAVWDASEETRSSMAIMELPIRATVVTVAANFLLWAAMVAVVVLAGRGKHFSAGADLNWMRDMAQAPENEKLRQRLNATD